MQPKPAPAQGDGLEGWFLTSAERGNDFSAIDRRRPNGLAWSVGNRVEALVHGATYFRRLLEAIRELGAGDQVYFTDWRGDPDQRLNDDPDSEVATVLAPDEPRRTSAAAPITTFVSGLAVADFVMAIAARCLQEAEWADPRFEHKEVPMDGTTALLILIVAVVVIVIAYGVSLARRGRLRSLSPENKARYAQSWSAIQARFLAEPAAAVQEADQLAVSILRDRGARMDDDKRLPADMRRAREVARTNEGDSGTEGLRKAMLQYQTIVDDAVGETMRKSLDVQRKEVAS
jgi:hypothetical protein